MDFSTLLGALGVVLTVVFFIVGYRQTIGARKERARAANKLASDAVFRRLTLETQFSADPTGITRLLSGWALEARVRLSDMYAPDDLHAVLLCRIVENDYLGADHRKEVMQRLEMCFKGVGTITSTEEVVTRGGRRGGTEIILAIASGLMALVGTAIIAFLTDRNRVSVALSGSEAKTFAVVCLVVTCLIILTTVALILFTRLRESTRTTNDGQLNNVQRAIIAERQFLLLAKSANSSIVVSNREWPDITFLDGEKKIAVEVKLRIAQRPAGHVQALIAEAERKCDQEGYSEVFYTSPEPARLLSRLPRTNRVKIVSFSEALERLRAAA